MNYLALASGSRGNCHAFSDGQRILLVDAGIPLKQIRTRLAAAGWDPSQIAAVVLSHEHSDHISAIPILLRNTNWLFIATKATLTAVNSIYDIEIPPSRIVSMHHRRTTNWEGTMITPFAIPHDAVDPVALRIELDGFHAAIVTDLGHQTRLVTEYCSNLDLLVIEANHDTNMLTYGNYPPTLKARILSKIGHLSNENMGTLLASVLSSRLTTVVLAHLSVRNNDPVLAITLAKEVLKNTATTLHLAQQHKVLSVACQSAIAT